VSGRRRRGLLRGRESFFAGHLAAAPGAEVIDSDDLVTRWSPSAEPLDLVAEWALEPVTRGPTALRRRFDWDRRRRLPGRSDCEMYRPFGSMWVEQEEAIRGGDHVWARADLMVGTRLSDVGEMGTRIDPEREFVCQDPSVA